MPFEEEDVKEIKQGTAVLQQDPNDLKEELKQVICYIHLFTNEENSQNLDDQWISISSKSYKEFSRSSITGVTCRYKYLMTIYETSADTYQLARMKAEEWVDTNKNNLKVYWYKPKFNRGLFIRRECKNNDAPVIFIFIFTLILVLVGVYRLEN